MKLFYSMQPGCHQRTAGGIRTGILIFFLALLVPAQPVKAAPETETAVLTALAQNADLGEGDGLFLPDADSLFEQSGLKELEEQLDRLFPEADYKLKEMFSCLIKGDLQGCFGQLRDGVLKSVTAELGGMKKVFVNLLLIGILSALLTNFADIFTNHQIADISFYFVYFLLIILLLRLFSQAVEVTEGVLDNILVFMKLFIPTYFCAVGLASGAVTAGVYYQLMLFLIYAVEWLLSSFIMPAIYCYVFLNIVNGLWMEERMTLLMEALKKAVGFLLKASITLVMGFSFIQSMITPVIDSLKSTALQKTVSAIPGIGNLAGGITEMVVGSAVLVKNSVGTLMMALIILICAAPVMKLLLITAVMKGGAALMGLAADKRMTGCTDRMGDGSFLLFKSTVTAAALFLITAAIAAYTTNRGF